jgi:hypothetical protein
MAPEGEDYVKGQACLGCKRSSMLLEPQHVRKVQRETRKTIARPTAGAGRWGARPAYSRHCWRVTLPVRMLKMQS